MQVCHQTLAAILLAAGVSCNATAQDVVLPTVRPSIDGPAPSDEMRPGLKIRGVESDGANLVLTAYSEQASSLYRPFVDYSSFKTFSGTAPFLLASGTNGIMARSTITDVKYDDPDRFIDPMATDLVVAPGQACFIHVPYWPAPGYGRVWMQADNGGKGYVLARGGDFLVLNLNYEFARTQLRKVKSRLAAGGKDGFSPAIQGAIAEAEKLLEQAGLQTCAARAAIADQALAKALIAGDDLELELAQRNIATARTGRLELAIETKQGKPVEGATIRFRQVNHDFLFGCVESFGFMTKQLSEQDFRKVFGTLRDDGFNHFTVSMFWDQLEEKPGQYRFQEWESKLGLKYAIEAGFSLKMHALLQEAVPKHVKGMKPDEFAAASRQYFARATKHAYQETKIGEAIVTWQAANEPSTNDYAKLDEGRKLDLLKSGADYLHANAPKAKVLINDVYADWGQRHEAKAGAHKVVSPYEMFELLNRRGVQYDQMGLEWYPGLRVNMFDTYQLQGPLQDFLTTSLELDRYESLGKPLHITEFEIPGVFDKEWKSGWWRTPWDEKVQAEYARRFYTIAFSKPHIHEITYWGISDNEPWVIGGGLMTKDYRPKPVLEALSGLIKSWTSSGEVRSDASGNAVLTGFGGEYEITVEKDGTQETQRVQVMERATAKSRVVLGA